MVMLEACSIGSHRKDVNTIELLLQTKRTTSILREIMRPAVVQPKRRASSAMSTSQKTGGPKAGAKEPKDQTKKVSANAFRRGGYLD